jgi:hypothetical protein
MISSMMAPFLPGHGISHAEVSQQAYFAVSECHCRFAAEMKWTLQSVDHTRTVNDADGQRQESCHFDPDDSQKEHYFVIL